MALGGFGFALSAVSSTVTSDPRPAGTAQVSAPRPPSTDPLPSGGTPTAPPPAPNPGATVTPTPTSTAPDDRHDGEHRARDDRAHDDGKGADDH